MPTGMALGPDNALYVSNLGPTAGSGHVVRIPIPVPTDINLSSFGGANGMASAWLLLLVGAVFVGIVIYRKQNRLAG